MWQHQDLREVYKKSGWKESDFVTKTVAARNARPNSPTHLNSTLNRPMASQVIICYVTDLFESNRLSDNYASAPWWRKHLVFRLRS